MVVMAWWCCSRVSRVSERVYRPVAYEVLHRLQPLGEKREPREGEMREGRGVEEVQEEGKE